MGAAPSSITNEKMCDILVKILNNVDKELIKKVADDTTDSSNTSDRDEDDDEVRSITLIERT